MNKGLTLRMNQCNVRRYMPRLLEHIREGRIDAKGIITHRFPLEDAAHAYHLFAQKRDDCIKCVLVPHARTPPERGDGHADRTRSEAWGADADPSSGQGVPMETKVPHRWPGAQAAHRARSSRTTR